MRKNKTKNNKSNKNRNNMDIIETRVRRFVAMIIDWYLTNMLAVIPITFYLRGNDYLKPYMFDLTHFQYSLLNVFHDCTKLTILLLLPSVFPPHFNTFYYTLYFSKSRIILFVLSDFFEKASKLANHNILIFCSSTSKYF